MNVPSLFDGGLLAPSETTTVKSGERQKCHGCKTLVEEGGKITSVDSRTRINASPFIQTQTRQLFHFCEKCVPVKNSG